ncbi:hypothetical protein FHW36_10647 [Chitinophaga polysaccharea]|uniref:Uncharacterized protein n=1 Tax=Chitinophaga polysaccharea TaxID=1293035 RepID=A0A561PL44_9BACT|nr:hypothetical protein FHW36_10647 [Chitinophaga polysaccharea]
MFVHLNKMFVLCTNILYNKCTTQYQNDNKYKYVK